jgi:hypothetical protein
MDEEAIMKMIQRRMEMLEDHILHARVADFPGYRGLVGGYSELEGLLQDIKNYLRALDQDPVDGDQ